MGVKSLGSGGTVFEDLVGRARDGDEVAFAALWRQFHPPLVRYLRVVAQRDAHDLASEVWLSIVRDLGSFTGEELGFRAWVFTIARHRAADAGRRRSRRIADTVPLDDQDPPDGSDVSAEAVAWMELDAGLGLLRSLPRSQADVIALRVISGLSVAETAALTGRSDGAVRVLAHRGLHQLRDRLSDEAIIELRPKTCAMSVTACQAAR
jgi:RNA polymerase sigma-70 factor (ECF subfamily)